MRVGKTIFFVEDDDYVISDGYSPDWSTAQVDDWNSKVTLTLSRDMLEKLEEENTGKPSIDLDKYVQFNGKKKD